MESEARPDLALTAGLSVMHVKAFGSWNTGFFLYYPYVFVKKKIGKAYWEGVKKNDFWRYFPIFFENRGIFSYATNERAMA